MNRPSLLLSVVAAVAACSSSSGGYLADGAPPDAAPPDSADRDADADGSVDAVGATDGTDAGDVVPAVDTMPFQGARSFVVEGKLATTPVQPQFPVLAPVPDRHDFTLRLDRSAGTLMVGGPGRAVRVPMTTSDGITFEATNPIQTSLPSAGGACGDPDVKYLHFSVTVRGDRVDGHADGGLGVVVGDVGVSFFATLTFSGHADDVPPSFGADLANIDPLQTLVLPASEPLAAGTTATLVPPPGSAADPLPLEPLAVDGTLVVGFRTRDVLLAYGVSYQLKLAGPQTDLAGNGFAPGPLTVATLAPPPLVAPDGFESVTAATVAGASVIDASFLPPIAGKRSVLLPPDRLGFGSNRLMGGRRFTARLAVVAGARMIHFKARAVGSEPMDYGSAITIAAAAPGGQAVAPDPIEWKGDTEMHQLPDGAGVAYLGAVHDVVMPLPAGTKSEVVVDISNQYQGGLHCGLFPPALGLLIDDLRTE